MSSFPRTFALAITWVAGLTLTSTADAQFNLRASLDDFGAEGDSISQSCEVSANGRYIAFASDATNLVPGDTNGRRDCFVYDTLKQSIERVSVPLFGLQGNADSRVPSISDDGRWVVFESDASNLVPNDTNNVQDSFLYDRLLGVIIRVSLGWLDQEADNTSSIPTISGDGNFVVFASWATNLVPNDNNSEQDIFLRDLQLGTTQRLSVSSSGVEGNDYCKAPNASSDGAYVTFESEASSLVPGDTNGERDVFLHDVLLGKTTRISVSTQGVQANEDSRNAKISADGRWVVFDSEASNLVAIDTNNEKDVFLHDRLNGTTIRVSDPFNGIPTDGGSRKPWISADGSVVTFASDASNLVPVDTNARRDIFRWVRATATTTRVSTGHDGSEGDADSDRPRVSADGRHIVFHSSATNLVPFDWNSADDVFQTGPLLTLEASDVVPYEGDTLNLSLWRAGAGCPLVNVLVSFNGVPLFLPLQFGVFGADGSHQISFKVPPGTAGQSYGLMSLALCPADGPSVFASNVVTLAVQ